jgi:hypothetical protein
MAMRHPCGSGFLDPPGSTPSIRELQAYVGFTVGFLPMEGPIPEETIPNSIDEKGEIAGYF